MQLQADSVNGDAALLEVFDHGVYGVRFGVHAFCLSFVVEEDSSGICVASPAKCLLDVGRAFSGEPDTGLIEPDRVFESSTFVEGFVDYVPGENLAGIVLHLRGDVFLQDVCQLLGSELCGAQPFGVVVIPNQAVAADFHIVGPREANNLISLLKIECAFVPPDGPPLHRVFRFDHVELATEGLGIGSLGKGIRTDSGAYQQACGCGGLAQACLRRRTGRKEQRQKTEKREQLRSCHLPLLSGRQERM